MKISITIEDIVKIPIIWSFDTDENCKYIIYSSNNTGLLQLYLLPTDLSKGPKQLTKENQSILGGNLSPDGKYIVYPMDKDGDEISHLFNLSTEDGEKKQISINPYRTMGISWNPDGMEISRTIISPKGGGIETINLKTEESYILDYKGPILYDLHYSHDAKWFACTSIKSFIDTEVSVINRKDPSDIIIYSIKKDTRDGIPSWSSDDKKLALFSEATGRGRLYIQEFQGEDSIMLELDQEEDANPYFGGAVWSPKGDKIYYIVAKHGRSTLRGHPIGVSVEEPLPFPIGTVEWPKISKDGKKIITLHSSLKDPYGLYIHELGTESIKPLTTRDFNIDITKFTPPQSIWYDSFDGHKIHGWYIPAISEKAKIPAVMHIHGGPWSQTSDSWIYGMNHQAFSQNGMAVLAPNYRGSTGYGTEFQNLDIGDPGGGDLEDVVYGAKWLKERSEIDGSKLSITGASYGGYMTLIALTKKPNVFVTGVSLVPVVDWLHMYKLSDLFFQQFEAALFGGKPRKELKQLYLDRSPITFVSDIKAPVMIMGGKNDTRCPIEPIERFIDKLKEKNHPHEFNLFEKAGHISAMFNWEEKIPLLTKTIDYIKKHLN